MSVVPPFDPDPYGSPYGREVYPYGEESVPGLGRLAGGLAGGTGLAATGTLAYLNRDVLADSLRRMLGSGGSAPPTQGLAQQIAQYRVNPGMTGDLARRGVPGDSGLPRGAQQSYRARLAGGPSGLNAPTRAVGQGGGAAARVAASGARSAAPVQQGLGTGSQRAAATGAARAAASGDPMAAALAEAQRRGGGQVAGSAAARAAAAPDAKSAQSLVSRLGIKPDGRLAKILGSRALGAVAAPITGFQVGEGLEEQFDRLDSSGLAGDIFSGGAKGAGLGAAAGLLGGPLAPISTPVGMGVGAGIGGLLGGLTGDRNRGATERKELHEAILKESRDFDVLARQGYLDRGLVNEAHKRYKSLVEEDGMDPEEAYQYIYGDLSYEILSDQEKIEKDLREAFEKDQQQMFNAMRYAGEVMAPMYGQTLNQFNQMNAGRDASMGAYMPGPTAQAMNFSGVDGAQAAVLASLANPMGHFVRQYPEMMMPNTRIAEQMLPFYMQPAGGGANDLGALIQSGALDGAP
jgi:hypothetical protein